MKNFLKGIIFANLINYCIGSTILIMKGMKKNDLSSN